jgi:uncharacterized membrane protein YcaP (DUF421 family)
MESVVRGAVVYLFLLIVFRFSGRRTLAETTTFDLVLLLIISETTQQAMVNEDHSVTNGFLLIITLIACDVGLSRLTMKIDWLRKLVDDVPTIVVADGKALEKRMKSSRVTLEDVLEAARQDRGLERLEQIKFAIVEPSGSISIIPKTA